MSRSGINGLAEHDLCNAGPFLNTRTDIAFSEEKMGIPRGTLVPG